MECVNLHNNILSNSRFSLYYSFSTVEEIRLYCLTRITNSKMKEYRLSRSCINIVVHNIISSQRTLQSLQQAPDAEHSDSLVSLHVIGSQHGSFFRQLSKPPQSHSSLSSTILLPHFCCEFVTYNDVYRGNEHTNTNYQ